MHWFFFFFAYLNCGEEREQHPGTSILIICFGWHYGLEQYQSFFKNVLCALGENKRYSIFFAPVYILYFLLQFIWSSFKIFYIRIFFSFNCLLNSFAIILTCSSRILNLFFQICFYTFSLSNPVKMFKPWVFIN